MHATARQQQVLDCIRAHCQQCGFPPTIRELAAALGIRSPNGVVCHLQALQRRGLLERVPGSARALRLVAAQPAVSSVARAGVPASATAEPSPPMLRRGLQPCLVGDIP